MSCPLCGDECHCTPAGRTRLPRFRPAGMQDRQFASQAADSTLLVDPEAFDSSEQQFAASMEASIEEGAIERQSVPRFIPESLTSRSEGSRSDQPPPADEQFLESSPHTSPNDSKSYDDLITAAALYEA